MLGTLLGGCRYAGSGYDLDFTFGFKILKYFTGGILSTIWCKERRFGRCRCVMSQFYLDLALINYKVPEADIGGVGVQHHVKS